MHRYCRIRDFPSADVALKSEARRHSAGVWAIAFSEQAVSNVTTICVLAAATIPDILTGAGPRSKERVQFVFVRSGSVVIALYQIKKSRAAGIVIWQARLGHALTYAAIRSSVRSWSRIECVGIERWLHS